MLTLVPVVLQLIQAGIALWPDIVSAAQTEVTLFNSSTPPTAQEQAQIDAQLDAAHAKLQAA